MSNISIIIPCYPPHTKYLATILTDIEQQTLLPKEVILAISETDDRKKMELFNEYAKIFNKKVEFKIINTIEKKLAGQNRNMGASVATGEYLMFVDADDSIHPQKMEITKYYLDRYRPNLLLHSYIKSQPLNFTKTYQIDYKSAEIITNELLLHGTFGDPPKRNRVAEVALKIRRGLRVKSEKKYQIHHGYITVKRSLLPKYKFINSKRGEDTIFNRDILWNEGNVLFVNLPLLNYNPVRNS